MLDGLDRGIIVWMNRGELPFHVEPADRDDLRAMVGLDPARRLALIEDSVAAGDALIARVGGEVVGFLLSGRFFGYDFMELLFVEPTHRRQGIGTALITSWEERATTEKLFTSTNESNAAMHEVCRRLGFVRSGPIDNLDEGDPEVVYFKPNPRRGA